MKDGKRGRREIGCSYQCSPGCLINVNNCCKHVTPLDILSTLTVRNLNHISHNPVASCCSEQAWMFQLKYLFFLQKINIFFFLSVACSSICYPDKHSVSFCKALPQISDDAYRMCCPRWFNLLADTFLHLFYLFPFTTIF